MYCPKCGKQVTDGAKYCAKCGHNLTGGGAVAPVPGPTPQPNPIPQPAPATLYQKKLAQAASEGLGMNWYKFVIYVQWIIGVAVGLFTGISMITGLQYGNRADLVYGFYSSLKIIDVIIGLTNIVLSVLFIYTRFGLKRFKANSIGIYLILPIISIVSTIIYLIVLSSIINVSLFDNESIATETIGTIVASLGLFIMNYIYFNHRRHLFNET